MSFHKDKAVILMWLKEYLKQEDLEPFSVFVMRTGFPLGFDIPAVKRLLENNFSPLTVRDDKVVKREE